MIEIMTMSLISLLAVDSYQTEFWIDGTLERPIAIGDGNYFEVNNYLAGRPERREPYFHFLQTAAYLIPQYIPPPISAFVLGYYCVYWYDVVRNNNKLLTEQFPRGTFFIQLKITF